MPRLGPSTRTVGSYWTWSISTSLTAPPRVSAIARPSPFRYVGLVEKSYFPHHPPVAIIIFMEGYFARISRSSSTVIVRFSTTTLSFRRLFISPSAIAPMACFIDTHLGMVLPSGRMMVSSKSNSSFRCTDSLHMASTSAGSFWYFPLERVSSMNCWTESSGSTGQLRAWMSGELPTPLATRVTDAPPATAASAALHPASPPPIIITSLLIVTIAVLVLFRFLLREPRHP